VQNDEQFVSFGVILRNVAIAETEVHHVVLVLIVMMTTPLAIFAMSLLASPATRHLAVLMVIMVVVVAVAVGTTLAVIIVVVPIVVLEGVGARPTASMVRGVGVAVSRLGWL